jgi:putative transposase
MARSIRIDVGNEIYHVINRANARLPIFFQEDDYQLFQKILQKGKDKFGMRIIAYCLMSNHFHLVLYPRKDGDMQRFMQWITLTHTQHWHIKHKTIGSGHLYQGRYKSFIIEKNDRHLLAVIRYVEHNPLRANMVTKAEDWKFSSISERIGGVNKKIIDKCPISLPENYPSFLNTPLTGKEQDEIRYSVNKGKPYGDIDWSNGMIEKYHLYLTTRNVGRPKNGT